MRRVALLALAFALPAAAEPHVYDRVVATVGTDIVTLSRLEFEARVELVNHGGSEAAFAPLPHDVLVTALRQAIVERLMGGEAARVGLEPDTTDLNAAVTAFKGQLQSLDLDTFLAVNEVSAGEFQRLLSRSLGTEHYRKSRMGAAVHVTDGDVDRELARRDVAHPTPAIREAVRQAITDQAERAATIAELQRLYARERVRIVDASFAAAVDGLKPPPGSEGSAP